MSRGDGAAAAGSGVLAGWAIHPQPSGRAGCGFARGGGPVPALASVFGSVTDTYEALPPTSEHLAATEVLDLRDRAFDAYFGARRPVPRYPAEVVASAL